ncbi:MAG: NAD(P)-dependent oxidoreductase [Candidatus Lokiarchaeota archaeon]|nr:NAD(P)-dependent oxidoreductase [Candidatus Lokiarchaeota archaeon]
MKKKKILLTGASGTIGKEIFRELFSRSKKYELCLLLRPSHKNKKLFRSYKETVDVIWGNIHNYEDVKKSVFNQDIIIHAAGVLPDIAMYDPDLAKLTNIGGTNNIINAMKVQQNKPKIIYTSSSAVYDKNFENPIIRISDPVDPNPKDTYTYTKIEAEKLIINSRMDYCIFRISYVASVDMLKFRPIMFHMPLDTPLEIIHVKDVAQAIVTALESDKIWRKIFNLGGGKDCQIIYRENLSDYYEIMGFGKKFLPETAFAKRGHYGGIYDPQETQYLQDLLNFQHYTLQDFYNEVKKWIGVKRYLAPLIKPIARWHILRKSEFYQKFKKNIFTYSNNI